MKKFTQNQEKLKKRAEELFSDAPEEYEPQYIGDPSKIFEGDDDEELEL